MRGHAADLNLFGRVAGSKGVNDAERLYRDPARSRVVEDRVINGFAASANQMGGFETKRPRRPEKLAVPAGLSIYWPDRPAGTASFSVRPEKLAVPAGLSGQ